MHKIFIFFLMIQLSYSASALDRSELRGYTLVDKKTIDGEFEGCDFNKRITFLDGTYYTCAAYSYTYSFMPTAYIYARKILYKGKVYANIKMVVEDDIYDMYRVPFR